MSGIDDATPAEWDAVRRPAHYNRGAIETISKIEDNLSDDQFVGYLWGNVIKYIDRWPHKGGVQDLQKAQWYLERLIKEAS